MPFNFSPYHSLFRCLLLALVSVWWCSFSFGLHTLGLCGLLCRYAFSSLFSFVACLLLLLIDEPWCYRVDYAMLPCPDPGVLPTCTWLFLLALGCPTHYLTCGRLIYVLARGCPTYRSGTWLPNTPIWHLVAQHITWHMVVYDLALGCPTLRSGTRLPNTSTWYLVSTWVPNMCSGQPGCTYHSISVDKLHTDCDTMRHLLFIRSGGYMWCTMDISFLCTWSGWTVYITIYFTNVNPQHSMFIHLMFLFYVHCYCLDVSLLAHPSIRTSPCSIPCLPHLYVICQHRITCHDVTVLYATVLVNDSGSFPSPFIIL